MTRPRHERSHLWLEFRLFLELEGRIVNIDDAPAAAEVIGYPLMIKASAGGGGRGIRVLKSVDDLQQLIPQASAEALAAFGDGGLYLSATFSRRPSH